jgi:tetratricopeptide (TPR) repeat protein
MQNSRIDAAQSARAVLVAAHAALDRGDAAAAEAGYREAIRRFGPRPEWLANLGAILSQAGRFADAVGVLRQARVVLPDQAGVLSNLGYALLQAGSPGEALGCLERATQCDPHYVQAWNNLGLVLLAQDDYPAAEFAFLHALDLVPRYTPALSNWCEALLRRGLYTAARDFVAARANRDPDYADAWFKYGYTLTLTCEFERAREVLERAAALDPGYAPIYHNLGTVALWQNRLDEAVRWFRTALERDGNDTDAQLGLGQALLKLRHADEGWRRFEARDARKGSVAGMNVVGIPEWTGVPLPGGTLIVHCEQGLGDVLQFARFLATARERVGRLLLHCDGYWATLKRLVATAPGLDGFVDHAAGRVPAAAICPLLSLPHALNLGGAAFAAREAYLHPPATERERWRQRMEAVPGLRVGLCWGGNPRINQPFASRIDERRSVPLDLLRPLFDVPGVHLFSLQKGAAAEASVAAADRARLIDWTSEFADYADTAAFVANLDLVVSVDTSVVHCAGALGVPVWMLDRFDNCWRWGADPTDPGWYRSLRVFRQGAFGEWEPVIAQVQRELATWAATRWAAP